MRAGRLKDKVEIQAKSSAVDGFGQPVDAWVTTATRRCSIEPLNGKEYFAAQGENVAGTVQVFFRYEAGLLDTKKRLRDPRTIPAVIYDIEDVIDTRNAHRELVAMCRVRG